MGSTSIRLELLNFSVREGLLPDLARCIEHVNSSIAKPSCCLRASQQYAYRSLARKNGPWSRARVTVRLASHRDFT